MCGAKSEPRPAGETPYDWGRETAYGQGKYFCPSCAPPHAGMILRRGVVVEVPGDA
jgi:hypothetical protein